MLGQIEFEKVSKLNLYCFMLTCFSNLFMLTDIEHNYIRTNKSTNGPRWNNYYSSKENNRFTKENYWLIKYFFYLNLVGLKNVQYFVCLAGYRPKHCKEIKDLVPSLPTGTYKIEIDGEIIKVRCEMNSASGGWTVSLFTNI